MTDGPSGAGVEPEGEVLIRRQGALGHIRLNRPRALNSLTLGMVRTMTGALDAFAREAEIAVVLLDGAGERGLCAGGDIRAISESGRRRDGEAERFLREEYALDARIAAYPKPYVAIMDGITMGGGVGISAHARHRVVTERTRFALPETSIGFIPDVGGTWLLPRAPGELGTYLGLTGETIGPEDAIHAGVADVLIAAADLPALHDALAGLGAAATSQDVSRLLQDFSRTPEVGALQRHQAAIDQLMAPDDVAEICTALDQDRSDWAAKARAAMAAASPTSLKVTLALLRLGRSARSLEECLVREYRAGCRALRGHDFYEGIRAAVIDKDRTPRWAPAHLAEVDGALVGEHLAAVTDETTIFARA